MTSKDGILADLFLVISKNIYSLTNYCSLLEDK